jgi:hypothetical protein
MTRHDKHELPLWLEEELRDIDLLIGILDAAKNSAFSLTSSPVGDLVSLLVDLIMRIKNSYEHGISDFASNNPEVVFLDDQPMGELGNSRQRTIKFDRYLNWSPVYKDPESSPMPVFLKALAVFFSRSLDPKFNFQKSFHGFLKALDKFLPPGFTSQKSKNAEKITKNTKQLRAQKARSAYYRRRRQR